MRPAIFTRFADIGEVSDLEMREADGSRFFFNCNDPDAGSLSMYQSLNVESAMNPDLRFALDVTITKPGYDWASLEFHVPMSAFAGRNQARILTTIRANKRDTVSLGYGGFLDRGRGFECFELEDFSVGRQFKALSLAVQFDALPMDEIENDRFVVALYLTKTSANTLSILDLQVEAD